MPVSVVARSRRETDLFAGHFSVSFAWRVTTPDCRKFCFSSLGSPVREREIGTDRDLLFFVEERSRRPFLPNPVVTNNLPGSLLLGFTRPRLYAKSRRAIITESPTISSVKDAGAETWARLVVLPDRLRVTGLVLVGSQDQTESAAILKIKESMQEEAKRFEKDSDHPDYFIQ